MGAILASLLAALKAIPAVADLIKWIGARIDEYSKAKQEQKALERKNEKDALIDGAVDAANRVPDNAAVQQRPPPDKPD